MGVQIEWGECSECGKRTGPLKIIEDDELCSCCLERRGGEDYIDALEEIEKWLKVASHHAG